MAGWLIDWPTEWLIGGLSDWLADWLLIDWLFDWLIAFWLIADWLTDCSLIEWFFSFVPTYALSFSVFTLENKTMINSRACYGLNIVYNKVLTKQSIREFKKLKYFNLNESGKRFWSVYLLQPSREKVVDNEWAW